MPISGVSGMAGHLYIPPDNVNQSQPHTGTNLEQQQQQQTDIVSGPVTLGNNAFPPKNNAVTPDDVGPGLLLNVVA